MSCYNGLRVNFAGGFYTNVCTTNNDDVVLRGTDPLNGMILEPYVNQSDDDLRAFFMQINQDSSATSDAPGGVYLNGGWNYMGDHETRFVNAKIYSCGFPDDIQTTGSLINQNIYILGSGEEGGTAPVMVDVDPTGGGIATQIYVGGIQIGSGDSAVRILHDTRCYSYFMGPRFGNLPSQGFSSLSVWWQFSIPNTALPATVADPALQALFDAARLGQGLTMRFSIFELEPGMSSADLAALFAKGQAPNNPGYSYLIGTLGVWGQGELASSVGGRILTANNSNYSLALAHVDLDSGYLTLDLSNAIPKNSYRTSTTDVSQIGPNCDIGKLCVYAGNQSKPIATFTPDPVNYWRYGGLVDIKLDMEIAQSLIGQPLTLSQETGGSCAIAWNEEPYRVESDQRGIYLANPAQNQEVVLRVLQYGQACTEAVTLGLSTSSSSFNPDIWPDPNNLVFTVDGKPTTSIVVPAGQIETTVLVVTNGNPGLSQINVVATGSLGQSNSGTFKGLFRVQPVDDYSKVIASGNIPWSLVYNEVLRYYYVIFPAMSLRIPLNDPATLKTCSEIIAKRLDESLFETTLYMPLTRCMSTGKKELLLAFLKQA
ncbi:MAG: hypothetical protein ACXW1U_16210 [Methylobacter sp.]